MIILCAVRIINPRNEAKAAKCSAHHKCADILSSQGEQIHSWHINSRLNFLLLCCCFLTLLILGQESDGPPRFLHFWVFHVGSRMFLTSASVTLLYDQGQLRWMAVWAALTRRSQTACRSVAGRCLLMGTPPFPDTQNKVWSCTADGNIMPEFDSIWVQESKGSTDFRHFSSIKSE